MTEKCTFCDSTDTAPTMDYSVEPAEIAPVCWEHGRTDD